MNDQNLFAPLSFENSNKQYLEIGTVKLWFLRKERDWTIYWHQDPASDNPTGYRSLDWAASPPEDATQIRFAFKAAPTTLFFRLQLGDRPFVVAPEIPFVIPAEEKIILYVGTSLWLGFAVSEKESPLLEIPTSRPSDTWFGPNTRSGELCYVAKTKARLNLEDFDLRQNRAITEISIYNHCNKTLPIDSLKIPIPLLELFRDSKGVFFTRGIDVDIREDSSPAINLTNISEHLRNNLAVIAAPRHSDDRNVLLRTFDAFSEFSSGHD